MGLWWETVEEVPKGGVSIKGDPNAWPKWNPLWRFQHKWMIFRVEPDRKPYYVFFDDGVDKMLCKKVIRAEFFVARIGQRNIKFVATIDPSDTESLTIFEADPCESMYMFGWVRVHYLLFSGYPIELI